MNQFDLLDNQVTVNNGYLLTAQVLENGVSKPVLADYVRKRNLERVAHGVYLSKNAWPDFLFQLYLQNRRLVFSLETALFLHRLMEREPNFISVTVTTGYNATHLRKQGIRVYQVKPDFFLLGQTKVQTAYGNTVCVYDMERTICDILRHKEKMDIQIFQYAIKEYMANSQKNLSHLMAYAKVFKLESTVRTYTEVML
ncbi:MAG: abortive phage infection protein [Acidaminococcaceae bacterium]|nr:abortive phage infection protein [Acidaminococcaceae bacterium]